MPRLDSYQVTKNAAAFLDTIAFSELGDEILKASDDGYNVLVGSRPEQVLTFSSYADHPYIVLDIPGPMPPSSAAGRYQMLMRTWVAYKQLLDLKDFSPVSQDLVALRILKETHADAAILGGDFAGAVDKCAHIWASLPGAGYGQHENAIERLKDYYAAKGGALQ